MVYVLAVAAAALFAGGSVVQQRVAGQSPPEKALSAGLLLWLVRRRAWLAGVVISLVGNILAALALGQGGVALVEPLFTVRLLFAFGLAPLYASFSVLVTVEPLTGLLLGVLVLHGALRVSPAACAGEAGGLIVMTLGVWLLAQSPLVTGQAHILQRRRDEALAYHALERLEGAARHANRRAAPRAQRQRRLGRSQPFQYRQ